MSIDKINRAIYNAVNNKHKLHNDIFKIKGMSNRQIRIFLNDIVSNDDTKYLEIGSYYGSTLCSALFDNSPEYACAIDNFSQFGGPKEEFLSNAKKYIQCKFDFFDMDCFGDVKSLIKERINIYFYDGGHQIEDHIKALLYYRDILEENFIYICDDWNLDKVKKGTEIGIIQANLKVEYSQTMDWWNGIYVAYITKKE